MERFSSPAIEKKLKEGEKLLTSKGISLIQARTIQRLPLYLECLVKKHKLNNPSDEKLFWLLRRSIGLTLDEVGDYYISERAFYCSNIDDLAPILKDSFSIERVEVAPNKTLLIFRVSYDHLPIIALLS